MPKSRITPTVGRVVIFIPREEDSISRHNGASELPAIVVRTWEHTSYENDELNLKVLTDGVEDTWRTSVPFSETKEPYTWHWPPRV